MARQRGRRDGAQRQLFTATRPPWRARSIATSPKARPSACCWRQGDIDIARNLGAEEITALADNPDIKIEDGIKGTIYYMGLNQKNEDLANPKVTQAMKYLVDYQAIADTIMKGKVKVHQTFLPEGFLGALDWTIPIHARRRQGEGAAGQGRAIPTASR